MQDIDVSVVIPVYRSEDTLEELYFQLVTVFQKHMLSYQLVFINDASPDSSLSVLEKIIKNDSSVEVFSFEENRGQHAAVLKGLTLSRGLTVVTLDADLQDCPRFIPELISKIGDGYHACFAGRRGKYESTFRLLTSKLFKFLVHLFCKVPKDAGMYLAMSRSMVASLREISMSPPFVIAMIGLTRLPTCSIPAPRNKRFRGGSAYNTWMRFKLGIRVLYQVSIANRRVSRGLWHICRKLCGRCRGR